MATVTDRRYSRGNVPLLRTLPPVPQPRHDLALNCFHPDRRRTKTYSLAFESTQIVTGPSLISATFMSAPNTPVFTPHPDSAATAATNRS